MVAGTYVGTLADKGGRKAFCLLYAALYIASCATKHFKSLPWLFLGRLLGGVATSLIFSVFESCVVCEHREHDGLPDTLTLQSLVNFSVAILSGILGQWATSLWPLQELPLSLCHGLCFWGGATVAFDAASLCLLLGAALISCTW